MPINKKAGLSTSFSAKDVVPTVSLSAKKLNLPWIIVAVKRMK